MIDIRHSDERGPADHGWLQSQLDVEDSPNGMEGVAFELHYVAVETQKINHSVITVTRQLGFRITALFIPVWWAWTGHALYATRFYDDGVIERLLTLGQMFLVTLMFSLYHRCFLW